MLGRLLARHRRNPAAHAVARVAAKVLDTYENVNYDLATNGELRVLEAIARTRRVTTVFDVGANVGDWAAVAARCLPDATVHAFEIAPASAFALRESTRSEPRIVVNGFGLSDEEATVPLKVFGGTSPFSSMIDYPHAEPATWTEAVVRRGDAYLAECGIASVDVLKVDVEGAERRVLDGFAETFDRGAIDVVQLEYGRANAISRFLLADIHQFFVARGFRVGKVYPTYVDFRGYHPRDEDFRGPNYLAVREERADILRAVG